MGNSSYIDILFTALGGIDGSVMPIIWFIAASILTVTFLWGVYDAFVRGGDVRSLGITMLKYAAVALVLMNWSAVFRDLVKSFDYVSNYIYGTNGLGDVIDAWTNGLGDAWRNDGMASMWELIRGGISALITEAGLIIGYVVLPFSLAIFTICFVFWGCVLYVLGPLVLATMPSSSLGRFHSRWIENLLIWNCWPLLADTLWTLMTAIHLNNPQFVLNNGDLWGAFHGLEGTLLLSLASIIFALLIATIPMTARRILMGEYSPIGAAIAWGRGAASKALAGTTMAAATGGTGAVAAAGAGGGGSLASGGGMLAAGGGGTLAPSGGVAMAGGGGVIPGVNSPLTAPPHTPPASPGGTRWFAVVPGGANMPFNFRVNGRRYS
jgi:hypothetical protein